MAESQELAGWRFLANMLEAYYFADTRAVNKVAGTNLSDFAGDVETIPRNFSITLGESSS